MSHQQLLLSSTGPFKATGGVMTQDATYQYHTFNVGETLDFVVEQGFTDEVDFELIGGGATGQGHGSGSGGIGGGGGAGDLIERFGQFFTVGTYPVVIANTLIGPNNGSLQGEDSTFYGLTALGGGAPGSTGADGGSGGGGQARSSGFSPGGDGLGENGNDGGNSSGFTAGAGGGAGSPGSTPNGGNGVVSNFDGTTVCEGGKGALESMSGNTNRGNGNAPGDGGGGSRNVGGNGGKGGNGFGGRLIIRYPLAILGV